MLEGKRGYGFVKSGGKWWRLSENLWGTWPKSLSPVALLFLRTPLGSESGSLIVSEWVKRFVDEMNRNASLSCWFGGFSYFEGEQIYQQRLREEIWRVGKLSNLCFLGGVVASGFTDDPWRWRWQGQRICISVFSSVEHGLGSGAQRGQKEDTAHVMYRGKADWWRRRRETFHHHEFDGKIARNWRWEGGSLCPSNWDSWPFIRRWGSNRPR